LKSIVYFSLVNWKWIKQRPHFIPFYLFKNGYNINYIYIKSLGLELLKNKSLVKNRIDEDTFNINSLVQLPFSSRFETIRKLNNSILKKQFFNIYRNQNPDIIIFTHPNQIDNTEEKLINKSKIIYECMDNMVAFLKDEKKRNIILKNELKLCNKADKIIVSSKKLKEVLNKRYDISLNKIQIIYNAFDLDSLSSNDNNSEINMNKNLTYIGTISEWIDFDILYNFARENKSFNILMVGPIDNKAMKIINKKPDLNNIHYYGSVEHKEIPKYIINSDVMLIPFKRNPLINCVDPVKAYEYLFFKKPVVSSYWSEMDKFSSYVYFYNNNQEFDSSVKKAMDNGLKSHSKLEEFLNNSTWEKRIEDYIEIIEGI